MKLTAQHKAFTLVELLVVITIIATLAGIAFPVYNTVQERGKQTKALTLAKQIGLSCKVYAGDYDGQFPKYVDPTADTPAVATTANQALGSLITGGYIPDEEIFFVQGSGWSTVTPDRDRLLEAGENNWAYFSGISDTDTPGWPLICDGWAQGSPGTYVADPKLPGGVWKGKKVIIIRVDSSGKIEPTNNQFQVMGVTVGNGKHNVLVPVAGSGTDAGWMTGVTALSPEKGT